MTKQHFQDFESFLEKIIFEDGFYTTRRRNQIERAIASKKPIGLEYTQEVNNNYSLVEEILSLGEHKLRESDYKSIENRILSFMNSYIHNVLAKAAIGILGLFLAIATCIYFEIENYFLLALSLGIGVLLGILGGIQCFKIRKLKRESIVFIYIDAILSCLEVYTDLFHYQLNFTSIFLSGIIIDFGIFSKCNNLTNKIKEREIKLAKILSQPRNLTAMRLSWKIFLTQSASDIKKISPNKLAYTFYELYYPYLNLMKKVIVANNLLYEIQEFSKLKFITPSFQHKNSIDDIFDSDKIADVISIKGWRNEFKKFISGRHYIRNKSHYHFDSIEFTEFKVMEEPCNQRTTALPNENIQSLKKNLKTLKIKGVCTAESERNIDSNLEGINSAQLLIPSETTTKIKKKFFSFKEGEADHEFGAALIKKENKCKETTGGQLWNSVTEHRHGSTTCVTIGVLDVAPRKIFKLISKFRHLDMFAEEQFQFYKRTIEKPSICIKSRLKGQNEATYHFCANYYLNSDIESQEFQIVFSPVKECPCENPNTPKPIPLQTIHQEQLCGYVIRKKNHGCEVVLVFSDRLDVTNYANLKIGDYNNLNPGSLEKLASFLNIATSKL